MTVFEWIFGIIIIVLAVVLVTAVLFQSGKEKGLSGTIVGGAESMLGKSKKAKRDAVLSTVTTVLSIVFAIIAVVMYIYIASSLHTH